MGTAGKGRGRGRGGWYGGNDKSTVFDVDMPHNSKLHPTMKPVELITAMLQNSTKKGQAVFDPFGGSGSTLIAAHILGRRALTIDFEPGYAEVIIERWKEHAPDGAEAVKL